MLITTIWIIAALGVERKIYDLGIMLTNSSLNILILFNLVLIIIFSFLFLTIYKAMKKLIEKSN